MPLRVVMLAIILAAMPTAASANVIWPGAILTGRLLDWWIIVASIAIEFLFVWRAFRLTPLNALLATIAANAASAAIGLFLLPFTTILLEIGLQESGIAERTGWDVFTPAGWAATFAIALALSLAIELCVFRFGYRLAVDRRAFLLILLANIITVGLALISLDVIPGADYGEVSPGFLAK